VKGILLAILVALLPLSASASDAGTLAPASAVVEVEVAEASVAATAVVATPPARKTLTELRDRQVEQSLGGRFMGLVGCIVLLLLALLLSVNRRRVNWRLVGVGIGLQVLFAIVVLKTSFGERFFVVTNDAVKTLLDFSKQGARFVFGNLVDNAVPVTGTDGSLTGTLAQTGALFAFGVLPTILFFSALSAILYHLGVLQLVVRVLASVMRRTMGTSGAESLAAAGNIFLGQSETPLLVRPFLPRMTRSELMALMTGGFATVAGGVMAAYVGMLERNFPDIAGHLVAASVMSAPAALVMAKIMVPETEITETRDSAHVQVQKTDSNVLDAAARGTTEGLALALNVAAMLIAFTAILPLLDFLLQLPGGLFGWLGLDGARGFFATLTLDRLMGWMLAPLAFVLGVPWDDAVLVGALLGSKTVVNEFVAFLQLSSALEQGALLHGKSVVIATYALCGFSNLASIGIQIGGLSVIAPTRRTDLAQLGFRAMIAASLACFMTAAVAGMLL
jgi:concentrative nucleoside transporter, CNT family